MPERISTFIIASIFATLLISSGVWVLSDIAQNNPTAISPTDLELFNNSFNRQAELEGSIGGIRTNIEDTQPEFGLFGGLNALVNVAWTGLKGIFKSFSFVGSAFTNLAYYFGIPVFIFNLLTLIIIVIFAFTIYSAIFQRDI